MWIFKQSTGVLFQNTPNALMHAGWAGQREGRNNPTLQDKPGLGPLPQGHYTIGAPHNSPHTGPYTMDLTPDHANNMYGRSAFRIHGAARVNPELSSEGCIIMPRPVREQIWASGDRWLFVVA